MKKIMFGLAAAIAMVAAADIESSNIVGYGQSALQANGTLVTAQFIPCVGGSMDLQSLIATGDTASDNVVLQTLDAFGRTVDSYSWINWYGDNGDESCWVDDGFKKVEGVTFAAGQGLFVLGSDSDQGLQSAGQVGTADVNVALRANGTLTGNPFPVVVGLQDIIATGDTASDNVVLQTLDAFGRTVDSYSWINWYGDNGDESCWVDDGFKKVEGVTFAAGQGLFVLGSDSDQGLQFPAPEL